MIISLGSGTRVLDVDVSQSNPWNLNPHLSTNNGSISVEPMLLNAGEGFIIKTIASQYDSHVSIDARIKGIKQIEKPKPPLKAIGLFILSAYLAVIGTVQANISVDPELGHFDGFSRGINDGHRVHPLLRNNFLDLVLAEEEGEVLRNFDHANFAPSER